MNRSFIWVKTNWNDNWSLINYFDYNDSNLFMTFWFSASYTADSVGSSTLGIKCRSFTDPEKAFVKYGHKALELNRVRQFLLLFGMSFPKLSRKLGIRQVTPEVSNFFYRVISETVEKRRKNNIDRSDFLQLLMNMQKSSDDGKYLNLCWWM